MPSELGRSSSASSIERWEIKPLERSRRSIDERLLLAAPGLLRPTLALAVHARPGSRLRRTLLGYFLRAGIAANNRGDYELLVAGFSPEVELYLYPDNPEKRGPDHEPIYRGREGLIETIELWKAGFTVFRWELREVVDPGGTRIAVRAEMVGRGGPGGLETRSPQFQVFQFEQGLVRREWLLDSDAAMLAMLE